MAWAEDDEIAEILRKRKEALPSVRVPQEITIYFPGYIRSVMAAGTQVRIIGYLKWCDSFFVQWRASEPLIERHCLGITDEQLPSILNRLPKPGYFID